MKKTNSNSFASGAGYVERSKGKEVKVSQFGLTTYFSAVSTTVVTRSLAALIATGSDLGNRVGRSIQPIDFDLDGMLVGGQSNLSTDDKYNTVRILIWYGISGASSPGFSAGGYLDPRYFSAVDSIIFDRKYNLRSFAPDSTGYMPAQLHVHLRVPLRRRISFSDTSAGTESGLVPYISIVSDSSAPPSPGFVNGSAALRFYD